MVKAFVAGVAATAAVIGALAQQPGRARWPPHARIPVSLDARTAPPGADALVTRALSTWTQAAGGRFVLERAGAADAARVRVRFAHADGVYGETAPRLDPATGMIGAAEVLIAGDIAGDAVQQRIVIYLTALHELGHALGLPHTDVFDDIMYSFRRPDDGERYFGAYRRRLRSIDDIGTARATGLSPADISALLALYDR